MDNALISDIKATSYREGVKEGIEIARQMLCKSLGKEIDSFGKAVAHVDNLIIKVEHYEKTTFDE